ncbi:uncharacterized protein LOC127874637 isoform X1 [Dreissena polymorpha]|uniref:Cyclic nucleotide-binding domain-containing protein n=2 Tax=Dreissena polymorpha TaxID=45954 RepID=A0A9D4L3M3_DREPO|nr:uncharacterized protein LOC127874637 isoform X1 [Dreissena polymorpha]KAH3851001.1 hypothetical protein DPMN_093478 [Dreissena polymorpha]
MEDVEERMRYEEEEVTTIHRKRILTQSTTRRKQTKDVKLTKSKGGRVQSEIKLSPFIIGAKQPDKSTLGTPPTSRKSGYVQKLVQETLNEYKGKELPRKAINSNSLFFGALDSDHEDEGDPVAGQQHRKWTFVGASEGIARFRKMVQFVILARHVFTRRRSLTLSRRDSILFFMDRETNRSEQLETEMPSFDVSAFKSIGQKTKMASVKSCLEIPPSERTDVQINHMVHTMRTFAKFANYPLAVQTDICKRGWYARFESSRVIVKEGSRAEYYYLILSGIAVYRDVETETEAFRKADVTPTASFLKPGDTLGEREILTNTERPATVVCKEHMEVLGLDRESLLDIFRAAGGLGSIEFLKSVPELSDFPLALLQTYHFSMAVHHYRRGSVIVKNSNDSEWVYIVKTGSCQVYKATKEARKERRQRSGSRPSSMTKRKDRVKSGLVFPRIKTDGLKSSSTVEINDADSKKKKVHPTIERAQTVMLPSVNPGKTSLINTVQENERLHSPNVRTNSRLHRESVELSPRQNTKQTPEKKKQKNSKKLGTNTPDILRLSRTDSVLRDTSVSSPRAQHSRKKSQSPSTRNKKSPNLSGSDSMNSPRKCSNISESNDMQTQADRNGHDSTRDDIGSTFFVRLGAISENGVFGMHSLVYDDMPNLSLVSQGAECVLISKQFLKDHITPSIANRLKAKLPPYPSSGQLRNALDDQLNWENYRDKVVSDILN